MIMRTEPSLELLTLFVRGRLDQATMDEIKSHLATNCKKCEAQMQWAKTILEAAGNDPSEAPPENMLAAGRRIFADYERRRNETNSRIFHAILMFDSAWIPLPAGARAPASGQRRLLFAAEPYEIDLEISRIHRGSFDLLGQVLPADRLPLSCRATLQQRGRKTAPLDTRGLFAFDAVAPGIAGLTFHLGEQTIKLSRVRIG